MLGQTTFAKLRDLASPTNITTLSLDRVVELLTAPDHRNSRTVQILQAYAGNHRFYSLKETSKDM